MKRAEVRRPWQKGLQMQTDEVGFGKGDNQRKTTAKVPMAESTRKGSKKEKGCTPMVMESHPMAKERAEQGAPAVAGSRVARGGGKSGDPPAVAGNRARGIGDSWLKQL